MAVLKSKIIGSSQKNLIILHGLYGSSESWIGVANNLSEHFTIHLLDLRNHGESFRSDIHTYEEMSDDVKVYLDTKGIESAFIIGHSMGGKVAMKLAVNHPNRVKKLVIADISPKSYKKLIDYDANTIFHLNLLSLMKSLDLSQYKDYRSLSKKLRDETEDIRGVVLKNIKKIDGEFHWQINVEALFNNLPEIIDGLDPDDFINDKINIDTLFLQAENSDYITGSDIKLISFIFSNYQVVKISNAGHWVHYDNPVDTAKAIKIFFNTKLL